jgi:hypothetical protein
MEHSDRIWRVCSQLANSTKLVKSAEAHNPAKAILATGKEPMNIRDTHKGSEGLTPAASAGVGVS